MVAIARAIIGHRTESFDPTMYRDRYQEALRELIEAKLKGLAVKPREQAFNARVCYPFGSAFAHVGGQR